MRESKTDKSQLIKEDGQDTEKDPLTEPVFVRETICGYDGLKVIIVSSIVFAIAITVGMVISILFGPKQVMPYGVVVTDAEVCTDVGITILKKGGSGMDAAVAASFCLGVVHGHSSGLGGGGFMMYGHPKKSMVQALAFREMSPSGSDPNMFKADRELARKGALSVAVPGQFSGLFKGWQMHGVLSWAEILQPSIELAEIGFNVTKPLAVAVAGVPLEDMSPRLKEIYAPSDVKVKTGGFIKRPYYAELLKNISRFPEKYSMKDLAENMANFVQSNGGIITSEDIYSYTLPEISPVLSAQFKDHSLYTMQAPSAGPALLMQLNILKNDRYTSANITSPLFYQRFVESLKFAEAFSTGLGDPLKDNNIQNVTTDMLSLETAAEIAKKINNTGSLPLADYYRADIHTPPTSEGGAVVTVLSSDGSMVSITSSLNSPFGSKLMTDDGVILNNAMENFDWDGKTSNLPSTANLLGPSKFPQSSLAPLLAWNVSNFCTRRFALGGGGGAHAGASVAYVSLQLLAGKANMTYAITQKLRAFADVITDDVLAEAKVPVKAMQQLNDIHKDVTKVTNGIGIVHGVMKEKDLIFGNADPRQKQSKASMFGR